MEIVETSIFVRRVSDYLSPEELRLFQVYLVENPKVGRVLQGSGGLRKVRWQIPGKGRGKRSGVRVIYFFLETSDKIYLLMIFGKNEYENLTKEQLKRLAKAMKEELL
jgi:mRNA-degrading endonuclease RelE of RelBE toxin-antitoxin system